MATIPTSQSGWGFRLLLATTSLRIVLVPFIMALILSGAGEGGDTEALLAALLFALAAATDFVDGKAARRWDLSSPIGSFLDTTADKLLVACTLLALVDQGRVASWAAAIIVARELAILGLRSAVALEGTLVEASGLGKVKASLQFVAIGLAILRPGGEIGGLFVDEYVMLAAVAVTVWSGADYVARFASMLRGR